MADLVLPDFPSSLVKRVDAYIKLLEELNPGQRWSRTACISTLLQRALAAVEGAELRWSRRAGAERRGASRGEDRRRGPAERRSAAYPEMVDLVIEHILKTGVQPGTERDETWRARHESDDV